MERPFERGPLQRRVPPAERVRLSPVPPCPCFRDDRRAAQPFRGRCARRQDRLHGEGAGPAERRDCRRCRSRRAFPRGLRHREFAEERCVQAALGAYRRGAARSADGLVRRRKAQGGLGHGRGQGRHQAHGRRLRGGFLETCAPEDASLDIHRPQKPGRRRFGGDGRRCRREADSPRRERLLGRAVERDARGRARRPDHRPVLRRGDGLRLEAGSRAQPRLAFHGREDQSQLRAGGSARQRRAEARLPRGVPLHSRRLDGGDRGRFGSRCDRRGRFRGGDGQVEARRRAEAPPRRAEARCP